MNRTASSAVVTPRRPISSRPYLPALSSATLPRAMRPLVLATRNAGKVRELERLLAALPVALVPAPADAPEVDETAPTLEGNALLKARALHTHTGLAALGDDTGLFVDALGGAPGIRSARYAGESADDDANRARMLQELAGHADRRAHFRTAIAFVDESGAARTFEGVCEGTILTAERGAGGFGYDALFVPDGHAETFAELPLDVKNRISHRARALEAFAVWLGGNPPPSGHPLC